jgi:hypothetical protein
MLAEGAGPRSLVPHICVTYQRPRLPFPFHASMLTERSAHVEHKVLV